MNKIVDRTSPSIDAEQPQTFPEGGGTTGDSAYQNDSIVTYRTDQNSEVPYDESDLLPAPNSATPKGLSVEQSPKDTLSDPKVLASRLMLIGIIGLSVVGGYLLGLGERSGDRDTALSPVSVAATMAGGASESAESQPLGVADAQAQALLVQTEITDQLGQMRAELLRLHTVFVRLAELAELDDGEFDLESPLLDWKEQSSLQKMGLLNRRIAHMSGSSGTLTSIFDLRRMAFDQKISGRPLVEGHRTSGFGYRTDPISGERLEHLGLDYSGPVGEPILALADGIVTFSGKNSGYGNLVELEHVDGLRTRYAHNQANLVKRGARVKKGEAIATLGSTGRSTGPHVHIEVRLDGSPIDPGFFVR